MTATATVVKKKAAKKAAKKTSAKKAAPIKLHGEGYKGHRPGTLKEKLHQLFDKHGAEKARPLALKTGAAPATINTSFSQFKKTGSSGSRKSTSASA